MIILRDAACETVRNKGWLSRTPASFQRAVLDRCRLERFKAGTPIYSIGDKPRGIFGIVAGCLSAVNEGERQRNIDLVIKYVISEEDAKQRIAELKEERLRVEAELAALEETPVPIAHPSTLDRYLANRDRQHAG